MSGPAVMAQESRVDQEEEAEPVTVPPPGLYSLDARTFYTVYRTQSAPFAATMRGVNEASIPVFALAAPVLGVLDLADDGRAGTGAQLIVSELSTLGLTFALKNTIRRTRPYGALPGVTKRSGGDPGGIDPFSFPSGHSAIAFSMATSVSLSVPRWYVVGPAMTWATATALARVWHGMHYPSDIVVGAALGSGVAIVVHALFANRSDVQAAESSVAQPMFYLALPIR